MKLRLSKSSLFDLNGEVALITGGASGLGLAMAQAMADHGASIALLDANAVNLKAAHDLLSVQGHVVSAHCVDVSASDKLRSVIDEVVDHYGKLDIAVANAGISGGLGPLTEEGAIDKVSRDLWDRVLSVNLTAAFETMQFAAHHMKQRRKGRIIVTSSAGGLRAEPLVGYAYAASKAAVSQLVRQAAIELAPYNVLVNAIAPGVFVTNIADGALVHPKVQEQFRSVSLLRRLAHPNEIKGVALLLASEASSYITGTVIVVDGGFAPH